MKLEQSFEVQAPIDVVWHALNDLERVAPCLPGAAITGHDDDGTYHGEFKVKLGPTTAAYKGTIKIESADESTHTATLAAKGSDKRGQGGANATIVNTLHEIEGGTRVDAVTDFSITGRLARFGRGGMIQDISNRLLRDFATCLATRLGEGAPVAASATAAAGLGAEVTTPGPDATGGASAAGTTSSPDATGGASAAATTSSPDATGGASAAAPVTSPDATGGASAGPPSSPDVTAGAGASAPAASPDGAGGTSAGTPGAPADATAASSPAATPVGDADATATPAGEHPAGAGTDATAPVPPATHAAGGPARTVAPPPPANEPLKAGSLFWSVMWERIKRVFGGGRK